MLRSHFSLLSVVSVSSRVLSPLASGLVWAAVAFSAVTWGLRWSSMGEAPSSALITMQTSQELDVSAAARSLGAAPAQEALAPSMASRFQLQGVLTSHGARGAALMSVDGKPAKPYRVGAVVADGLVLQSVQGRRISMGPRMEGPSAVELVLPPQKENCSSPIC